MSALLTLWPLLRAAAQAFAAAVPRPLWYALAAVAVVWGMWRWHDGRTRAAYADGARVQAAADRAAYAAAASTAAHAQHDLAVRLTRRQSTLSKETADALAVRNSQLARSYADLRLRWTAYRADPGAAGGSRAVAVPQPAAGADDTACAAAGWVAFDAAAAAAQAADTAIARDDAWIAWAAAQAAARPKEPASD